MAQFITVSEGRREERKEGGPEGGGQRDTELEQQHNYRQQKQSVPMDDTTVCMV